MHHLLPVGLVLSAAVVGAELGTSWLNLSLSLAGWNHQITYPDSCRSIQCARSHFSFCSFVSPSLPIFVDTLKLTHFESGKLAD